MKRKKCIAFLLMLLLLVSSILYSAPNLNDVLNMEPKIELSGKPKIKPVDIVIMTDYTGTKRTALDTQINNLKAKLENVNVDPNIYIIDEMKKVGTQEDEIYKYRRYAYYRYFVTHRHQYNHSAGNRDTYNFWDYESLIWEEREGLASQYSNLPQRNPTNITFTKSNSSSGSGSYLNVTLKCSNDVQTTGNFSVTRSFRESGYEFSQSIQPDTDYVEIDTMWKQEEKVDNISYDVYSLNFNKLDTLSLRSKSDRHMVFISDAAEKDFSKGAGNYFCFGDMTDSFKNFIETNNFTLYGVVHDKAKDRTFLPDKVVDVVALGDKTFLYMKNGDLFQFGDYNFTGGNIYPPKIANEAVINEERELLYEKLNPLTTIRLYGIDVIDYTLNKDGNVEYLEDGVLKLLPNVSDVREMYESAVEIKNYNGSGKSARAGCLLIVPNNKNMYHYVTTVDTTYYGSRREYKAYSIKNSKIITTIEKIINEKIFFTSNNTPYVLGENVNEDATLFRLEIESYNRTVTQAPKISAMECISVSHKNNYLRPILVLYDDGTAKQYELNSLYEDDGWRNCFREVFPNPFEIKNVKTIANNDSCFFMLLKDGTVKQLSVTRVNQNEAAYTNQVVDVPLTNIVEIIPSLNYKCFFRDSDNNIFVYDGTSAAPLPVMNSTIINLGNNIDRIIEDINQNSIFILYKDSSLGRFITKKVDKLYTDVKDVFTSDSNIYVLMKNGSIIGKGRSQYGQIGKISSSITTFTDPFKNYLVFDETKTYYSLLDIMNKSPDNKFYPIGQYAEAFNEIYKKYENYSSSGELYILLNEEVEYIPGDYEDRESDLEYERLWLTNHNPNYFDNSMGLSAYHNPKGKATIPPSQLDKVGKYVINLKVRDNPKNNLNFKKDEATISETNDNPQNYYMWSKGNQNLTIYVHRKPMALMNVNVTQNPDETWRIIATDGGSYDLDHEYSRADKGIIVWEWAWKDNWENNWHYERMNKTNATGDRTYTIALRVKDVEGVWSDWVTQTIDNRQPPIARFDLTKNPISSIEKAQIKDASYAIMSNLTNWHWIVKKKNENGTIGSVVQDVKATSSNTGAEGYDTTLNITRTCSAVGEYRIYLRVKADNGLWSDGGTDAAPNTNNMFFKDIRVNQALEIKDITITGRWNHFRGWTDKFGVYKDVMKDITYTDVKGALRCPYRFLSYEKIDINIELEGYADRIIINMPDGLDRMVYTDKIGYTYRYSDDIGYMVSFPYEILVNPETQDPKILWTYILPLVDSSVSWNNARLKQPYTVRIKAIKGTYDVIQEMKVDITGNVDDLIFIQPVAR